MSRISVGRPAFKKKTPVFALIEERGCEAGPKPCAALQIAQKKTSACERDTLSSSVLPTGKIGIRFKVDVEHEGPKHPNPTVVTTSDGRGRQVPP
jgi:hypothetical protein